MTKVLSRAKLKLSRMKNISQKIMGDKRKVTTAQNIREILTDKEYSVWVRKLSKAGSPEEQEIITAEYFKEIGKYDKLNDIVRII